MKTPKEKFDGVIIFNICVGNASLDAAMEYIEKRKKANDFNRWPDNYDRLWLPTWNDNKDSIQLMPFNQLGNK